jgi:retron-type reverse transcriptase
MKRPTNLLPAIADPDNLRLAFLNARRGKSYSWEVRAFQADLDRNLLDLRRELLSGKVTVGEYRQFTIYEPKQRLITAGAFRENVLHHAILNCCHATFERKQIFDSYACRKGKGTYAALERAVTYTRRYDWYLKLDVRRFFPSIHHGVLREQLRRLFRDRALLAIFDRIIAAYADEPGRGLPLGNLTSQYFANHYLSGLDHAIKERLFCRAYARYMDDMVLWAHEKAELQRARAYITAYAEQRLRVKLKPAILNRTRRGLPFLGYRLFPYRRRLTHGSRKRFLRKCAEVERNYHSGLWDEATCQRRILPLLTYARWADTEALRKAVFNFLI